MRSWMRAQVDRLAGLAALSTDSPDERLHKGIHVLAAVLVILLAVNWVGIYWMLGLWAAGAIPLLYQVVSIAGLVALARTRRFDLFRVTQGVMMLLLPFVLQSVLGGFVASGGVMVWAFWAPMGQLMSEGSRKAVKWFAAFLVLVLIAGLLEPSSPGTRPRCRTRCGWPSSC